MKILFPFNALGVLAVVASTATAYAQETAFPQPIQAVKSEKVTLKSVPARIMAWWLDPQHNERPIEFGGPQGQRGDRRMDSEGRGEMFQLPEGVEMIAALDTDNALLIRGAPQGLSGIKATITFLDKPIRVVELEMRTVRVRGKDADTFVSNGKDLHSGGMRIGQDDVEALLQKLQRQNKAEVVQLARSVTINNGPTRLVNRWETNVSSSQGKGLTIYAFQALNVVPSINNDDTFHLQMWWTSETTNAKAPDSLNRQPVLTSKRSDANVIVRDGQTFALTNRNSLLAPQFSSNLNRRKEMELVYLVTARIMPVPKK